MQDTVTHCDQSKFIFDWFNINCYGYCTCILDFSLYPTHSFSNLCTWRLIVHWVSLNNLKALPVKIATFMMKDLTALNIKWDSIGPLFFLCFFILSWCWMQITTAAHVRAHHGCCSRCSLGNVRNGPTGAELLIIITMTPDSCLLLQMHDKPTIEEFDACMWTV